MYLHFRDVCVFCTASFFLIKSIKHKSTLSLADHLSAYLVAHENASVFKPITDTPSSSTATADRYSKFFLSRRDFLFCNWKEDFRHWNAPEQKSNSTSHFPLDRMSQWDWTCSLDEKNGNLCSLLFAHDALRTIILIWYSFKPHRCWCHLFSLPILPVRVGGSERTREEAHWFIHFIPPAGLFLLHCRLSSSLSLPRIFLFFFLALLTV